MANGQRRPMVISPLWLQGVILTFVFGFAVLGYLALRVYQDHAPVPGKVVSETGQTVFTGEDILLGQRAFLTYGLMEYGSVYGHGAYLGPDFTADYLHRQALEMQQFYGGGAEAQGRVQKELQANRYDPAADTLTWTDGQVRAFEALAATTRTRSSTARTAARAWGREPFPTPTRSARSRPSSPGRPGPPRPAAPADPYSYTNNWPPEPLVGNQLTEEAVVWSTLSIIALLGGIGLMLTAFGRYSHLLGWHGAEDRRLRFLPPAEVSADPGPAVHGLVLLRGRRPVPGADASGRGDGPLPRRDRRLLRPGSRPAGSPTT